MTTGGLQSKYAGTTALTVLLPRLFSLLLTENIWFHDCNPRSHVRACGPHRRISKGKAVPLQAWSGPECSRKLGFPDFMTTAQDGGKVVSLTHRPHLPPGNTPGTHFC